MDWKLALKIGGPSILAAWLFNGLMFRYLETSQLLKTNIYLNVLVIVIIFIFCSLMGWLWTRKNHNSSTDTQNTIENNEITSNQVGSDMEVGSSKTSIKGNKITDNKVDGNLKIG